MKEDFLHYVWQYRNFDFSALRTEEGEDLSILGFGDYLRQPGPDFFNARLLIGKQVWAGNIEMHVKSSDWYLHNHEQDAGYDNVILHVVWEHDVPVFRSNNTEIPVLVIQKYISPAILASYRLLMFSKSWIYCENQLQYVDGFVMANWQERLFLERLERKCHDVGIQLSKTRNDWESVLFNRLARNFGLNINGNAFSQMAASIPFSVIRKERNELANLEALFLGTAGLLNMEFQDTYPVELKDKYIRLRQKYGLDIMAGEQLQFFKLRPDNFPTIRLAQLAMLYHRNPNLFSKVTDIQTTASLYRLFETEVSVYWNTHYQFDRQSRYKRKRMAKPFIDLLALNTILPMQFMYSRSCGGNEVETILELARQIKPEKNIIVERFARFGVLAASALESQAMLQLKNEYCAKSKCLECAVGIHLLKQ